MRYLATSSATSRAEIPNLAAGSIRFTAELAKRSGVCTRSHRAKGAQGFALLPAAFALSYFLDRFATAESRLGREREIAADAVGAQATNPRACASALMKIHAFAPLWMNLYEEMHELLQQKQQFINASSYWASKVALGLQRQPNFIADIDTSTTDVGHPTDTHPPLGVRLNALQVPAGSFVTDAAQCAPLHPAIELDP